MIAKLTGIFFLISGWIIALAAVALLPAGRWQAGFALAGVAVEAAGLALLFRSHRIALQDNR